MNITFESVTKRFGAVTAVDNVSLEVEEGESFFLLGPSGCGKTTLLRCVAGFCEPDAGRILFDGQSVTHLPPHKRNTGMVFQNYALWPHLTVEQNVAFGLTVPGRRIPAEARTRKVGEMLRAVRMEEYATRKPNQLSGGQQQRVALARALAIGPGCLLLDEPLSNLDAKLRQEMRHEIKRLVKDMGITSIYVTHDQKEALSMADRCAVLKSGRVEQIGSPRELYERPANRFVADFLGAANLIPGTLAINADNEVNVKTACGEWRGRSAPAGLESGASAAISIRPEAIRRVAPDSQGQNVFSARLTDWVYLGDMAELWLTLPDGMLLKAIEAKPGGHPPLIGGDVRFQVDPIDVVVLA